MKTLLKVASVVALVAGGTAWAASSMDYKIELGGDNNQVSWKGGGTPAYTRNPTGENNGQQVTIPADVDWAVNLSVSGTHSDPGGLGDALVPSGAANMVVDLELRTVPGNALVGIGAATVNGSGVATTAGWYSTINNGTGRGPGGIFGTDPLANAAFAIAMDANANGTAAGRVIDNLANDGPAMDFFTYPSAAGRPVGSTAANGELLGMGAGYKEFKPTTNGGTSTAGVGIGTGTAFNACKILGVKPVFEGQISTTGMTPGTYKLVLTAGVGNNILPGRSGSYPICNLGPVGRFAMAPNGLTGDDITFELVAGGCSDPSPTVVSAVSQKNHGANPSNPFSRSLPGVEMRAGGATKVVVTFSTNIALATGTPADVSVTSGTVSSISAAGTQLTINLTGATNQQPLVIGFPGVQNAACATSLASGTVCARLLYGDADGNATVAIFDLLGVRQSLSTAVGAANFNRDIDANNSITIFDLLAVRQQLSKTVPACP